MSRGDSHPAYTADPELACEAAYPGGNHTCRCVYRRVICDGREHLCMCGGTWNDIHGCICTAGPRERNYD